jgi:hypothetical protein
MLQILKWRKPRHFKLQANMVARDRIPKDSPKKPPPPEFDVKTPCT